MCTVVSVMSKGSGL